MNPNWVEMRAALKQSRQMAKDAKNWKPATPPTRYYKNEVGFQHPAKGKDHCRDCVHFRPAHACEIIVGYIRPEDWCEKYSKG